MNSRKKIEEEREKILIYFVLRVIIGTLQLFCYIVTKTIDIIVFSEVYLKE